MSDFPLPPLDFGERVYRALLRLYPPRFRDAFARDLVEAFRDERRDARRRRESGILFWLSTLQDVLTHSCAEWMSMVWRVTPADVSSGGSGAMNAMRRLMSVSEYRFAARRLRRAPGFALASVLVLALGIGSTTAVFSLVNGVLLAPLPYPESDRLVRLTHTATVANLTTIDQSDGTVMLYQRDARAFDGLGAWRYDDGNLAPTEPQQNAARVNVARVTANLFDVLRVRPALGKNFATGDDRVGAARVAIVSHKLWQERLHADPRAIGRLIVVNDVPRTIIGVMPARFGYPSSNVEVWLPVAFDPAQPQPASFNYTGVARLKPGVSVDEARADLARVLPRIADDFPGGISPAVWRDAHVVPQVESLRSSIVGSVSRLLWLLMASVLLVLLVACANVAGLFLVRAEHAQVELAVRGALGSGLSGMLMQSLSESVLLSMLGGGIGLLLSILGVRLAVHSGDTLSLPRLGEVGVDARALLFVFGVSVFCAAFVSLLPLLRARRVSIAGVLRGGGPGSTGGRSRQRARNALVVGQTALALILLAASGLMTRSFMRLTQVKPGFDADNVVTARVLLPFATYGTIPARMNLYNSIVEQARAIPGVRSVGLTDWMPLSDDHNDTSIEVEEHMPQSSSVGADHFVATVDGEYFNAMRIPLMRGRVFGAPDAAHPSEDVMVSHAFAERYWHGASPIGKRIRPFGGGWHTIIGEVGDAHYDALDKPVNDIVYFPIVSLDKTRRSTPSGLALVVRTDGRQSDALTGIRRIVHSLDQGLPTYDEKPVRELVRGASARAQALVVLLAIASALALALGAIGLYGVMAYGVSMRRRELGVRIALGARPADVSRMVARDGMRLAVAGIAIGLVGAIATSRVLRGLLYDVSATDPLTLFVTVVVLLGVALAASWVPARRAAAVDPAGALRSS